MKIGIITFWTTTDNYGQLLQCWALQQQLLKLGHKPYLIKYNPYGISKGRRIINWLMRHFGSESLYKLADMIWVYMMPSDRDARKFNRFRAKRIVSLQNIYTSIDELRSDPPQAQAYICGSDQIWNMSEYMGTSGWFLDFGNPEVRRISYAASFGSDKLSPEQMNKLPELLEPFYRVSVRERSGIDICTRAGFGNAVHVLDPSLLLDAKDYLTLCDSTLANDRKEYIFAYILNVTDSDEFAWPQVEEYLLERKLDLKPVVASGYITMKENLFPGYTPLELTLPQWLDAMRSAKGVVTTSFHGVALSVVMRRPFVVFLLRGSYSAGNNRILSFLEALGLSDRIYNPEKPFAKQMDASIDWLAVEARLVPLQTDSINYLIEALKQ